MFFFFLKDRPPTEIYPFPTPPPLPISNGMIEARHSPPRYFKFSYLITAWTQRPEDEHRLLSAVLRCFLRYEVIPSEVVRSEEHTSELQSRQYLVCRLLLEKKKKPKHSH